MKKNKNKKLNCKENRQRRERAEKCILPKLEKNEKEMPKNYEEKLKFNCKENRKENRQRRKS